MGCITGHGRRAQRAGHKPVMAIFADHLLVPSRTDCFTDVMWPVCASSSTPKTDLNSDETFFHMSCANGLDLVLPVPCSFFSICLFFSFFFSPPSLLLCFPVLGPLVSFDFLPLSLFLSFLARNPRFFDPHPFRPDSLHFSLRVFFPFQTSRATCNARARGKLRTKGSLMGCCFFSFSFFTHLFFTTVIGLFSSCSNESFCHAVFRIIRSLTRSFWRWDRVWDGYVVFGWKWLWDCLKIIRNVSLL